METIMDNNFIRYTLRINKELFAKFRYIAESEGRSANRTIEQYIKKRVAKYEEEYGIIEIEEE